MELSHATEGSVGSAKIVSLHFYLKELSTLLTQFLHRLQGGSVKRKNSFIPLALGA